METKTEERPYLNVTREIRVLRTRLFVYESRMSAIVHQHGVTIERRPTTQEVADIEWIVEELHRLNIAINHAANAETEQRRRAERLEGEAEAWKSSANAHQQALQRELAANAQLQKAAETPKKK